MNPTAQMQQPLQHHPGAQHPPPQQQHPPGGVQQGQQPPAEINFQDHERTDAIRMSWNIWPTNKLDATRIVVP